MVAELPILPLKTDALLADTTHMTAEEFGVYCRLLFVMWRHGGKLKDDDLEMATIAGVPLKRWHAVKEKVMRPMTAIGGLVSQGRLTDTWLKVQEVRRTKALASDIRWKGRRKANAMHMHDHVESTCNPNQIRKIDSSLSEAAREVFEEQDRLQQKKAALQASPELLEILNGKTRR
jgi:uncharacterized protein YdaU (DUF1376 family)